MFNKLAHNSRNLLILGTVLAVLAFALAFVVLSRAQQTAVSNAAGTGAAATPTPVPAPALIAVHDVPAFTPITDLKTALQYFRSVPVKGYIDPDYVHGATGLAGLIVLGPRHLAIRVPMGQPLLNSELISNTVSGAVDYSTLLNAGEVAETIAVQPVGAANGSIQPSDHVDLLLSMKFDLTKDQAAQHAFYQDNGTTIGPNTPGGTYVGNLWETQTTLENLRVLNVAGNNYTLAVTHQDAVLLKWVKDMNGTVDLVVRAADDSGRVPHIFHTTAVLPDYIVRNGHLVNHFVLP